METWIVQRPRGKERGREEPEVSPGEGRRVVGGTESKMLYIISLLCPRLEVLLRSRWQSQAGDVEHRTLGTWETARI